MPTPKVELKITARDETRAAFSSIRSSFGRLGSEAGRLRTLFAGLGVGLTAASFVRMIKGSIDAAGELNKLSQKIGISVEALSTLRFAADLSDVSLETLQTAVRKLSQGIIEASTGTGKAADVFQALGISVKAASGEILPTEQLLLQVADRFANLEDGAVKSALAVQLFGRSGLDLIPFLNQGAAGISDLTAEAKLFAQNLTTEGAQAAEQFNDNLTALTKTASSLGIVWAEKMLPEIVNITNAMREAAKEGGVLHALFAGLKGVAAVAFGSSEIQKAKDQIADLTEKVTDLRDKVATGKSPIPFLPFDIKFNDEALTKLKSNLAEAEGQLSASQKRLQQLVAPLRPAAKVPVGKPGTDLTNLAETLSGGAGAKKKDGAREQLAALKAQIQGTLLLLRDANDRALGDLDTRLADQTISLKAYYAKRVGLEQGAIDAEIAALQQELTQVQGTAAERQRIESEITILRRKRADVAITSARDEAQAETELNRTVTDLRARLLEAEGRPLEARRLQIEEEIARLRESIPGTLTPEVQDIVVRLRGAELARAEFDELQRQLQEIEARRHLREQSIEAETATQLFGEYEQRSRLVDVYQETAAALDGVLPRLQALAAANPSLPEISRAVEQAETELVRLRNTSDQTSLEVRQAVKGGVSDLFTDLISGSKSASDAFTSFAESVIASINRIIAERLAAQLFGSLFGASGGGGAGKGAGGIFSFLGFAEGGLVSGPGTSTSDSIPARLSAGEYVVRAAAVRQLGTGLLDAINGRTLPAVPRLSFADGGLVVPEPVRSTASGPGNTIVNMTVMTPDANSFRQSQGQIAAQLRIAADRGRRNL